MTDKVLQVATIANLIEIGKRVVLRVKSDAIRIPTRGFGENTDLSTQISEDLGAELLLAIRTKEAKEGIINAQ